MNENSYEKLLNIKTAGDQKLLNDSFQYNIYEPTSYEALSKLIKNYEFNSNDSIIDFGCGKGRLNFFLHHNFGCTVKGIEMNPYYYKICNDNLYNYKSSRKNSTDNISFLLDYGEKYKIKEADNKFYFFNPFSVQIFIKILKNITTSFYDCPRTMDIILFYPSIDFIDYLENYSIFQLHKEIPIKPKYNYDANHRFLIYRVETI